MIKRNLTFKKIVCGSRVDAILRIELLAIFGMALCIIAFLYCKHNSWNLNDTVQLSNIKGESISTYQDSNSNPKNLSQDKTSTDIKCLEKVFNQDFFYKIDRKLKCLASTSAKSTMISLRNIDDKVSKIRLIEVTVYDEDTDMPLIKQQYCYGNGVHFIKVRVLEHFQYMSINGFESFSNADLSNSELRLLAFIENTTSKEIITTEIPKAAISLSNIPTTSSKLNLSFNLISLLPPSFYFLKLNLKFEDTDKAVCFDKIISTSHN